MRWECADCNMPEGKGSDSRIRVNGVCHHCGKPLCHNDQVPIADEAFATAPGEANQEAVHCRECAREYHPVRVRLWRERR
jgi:hypothetical protein